MKFGCRTSRGNVLDINEDSYFADVDKGLFIIADGLGGQERGDVASRLAVDVIAKHVLSGGGLVDAVYKAHEKILKESFAYGETMASTVVSLRVAENRYEIAWVGDSRAYLFDGCLHQLTSDHTHIQRLVDEGELSDEEAQKHPERSFLAQALGEKNEAEILPGYVEGYFGRGQQILLCSDGLTDEISASDISDILSQRILSYQSKAARLVRLALEAGGKDNVTAVLVSNRYANPFEELCKLAAREKWCWRLCCTTCGHLHFRYAFAELAAGKSPVERGWVVHGRRSRYQQAIGPYPKSYTEEQKEAVNTVCCGANLREISKSCRFPDWLGYLGLVLFYMESDSDSFLKLSRNWALQLSQLVSKESPIYSRLAGLANGNGNLDIKDLEGCEYALFGKRKGY